MKEKTMEEIMARVFSRVNQSGQESQGLKDAVEIYKARGKWTDLSLLMLAFVLTRRASHGARGFS